MKNVTRKIDAGQLVGQTLDIGGGTSVGVELTSRGKVFGPLSDDRLAIMWTRISSASCDPISIDESLTIAEMLVEQAIESLFAAGMSAEGVRRIMCGTRLPNLIGAKTV